MNSPQYPVIGLRSPSDLWELWKQCLTIAEDRIAVCDAAAARFEEGSPERSAEMCAGIEARYIANHIKDLEPE